jgi:hypothetical protein
MEEQHWLDAVQETMLVVLSFVRLLISGEHLSIENSGIVLAVTLINSADLLALSQALQYHDVIIERFWMYIGLVLLTIGLFQFAFIDTDGLTPFIRTKKVSRQQRTSLRRIDFLQDQHLCPLFRVSRQRSSAEISMKLDSSLSSCTMVCFCSIAFSWPYTFVAVNH